MRLKRRVPVLAAVLAFNLAPAATASIGNWGDGSWCWFGDPRAVRVATPLDRTFVGWIDRAGGITIGSYDAATRTTKKTVLASAYHDDHSSPSLLVEPDKRLTVFWSGHNGSALYYRTSRHPESISGWGPVGTIPSNVAGTLGFTYPNPLMLSAEDNTTYLMWRGGNWSADYTTRDGTAHWTRARALIANRGQRPYVKADSNGRDMIALAFTQAHPRDERTSVYYMQYHRGWLHHASGRLIAPMGGRGVSPGAADVVYNGAATGISGWVWDVALTSGGDPVVVYATFPSAQDHVYWYARWTGHGWVSHPLTHGGPTISPGTIENEYSGGLALDHANPNVVYLSRKVQGWFEIERWTTADAGRHWSHNTVVRTPGADNVRPVVTRGSDGGPLSLLWLGGHYGTYTDYHTSIEFLR
jgi:hypothetical protein